MDIKDGEKSGTQLVTVKTDGSADISKRDAAKTLDSKYKIKDWEVQESESGSASDSDSEEEALAAMKSNNLAETQEWTNAAGQTITAAIRKVEKGNVHFIMPDGKMVAYPASKLAPETIAKIKELMP